MTRILRASLVQKLIEAAPEGRIRRLVRFLLLTGMHPRCLAHPEVSKPHMSRGDLVWNRAKNKELCSLEITPDIEELVATVLANDLGMSERSYRHYIRLAGEKAGLEDISPLTLRHTAVQYLFGLGKTPQEVRETLGCSMKVLWENYAVVRARREEEEE